MWMILRRRRNGLLLISFILITYIYVLKFLQELGSLVDKENNEDDAANRHENPQYYASSNRYLQQKKCSLEQPAAYDFSSTARLFSILPSPLTDRHIKAIISWKDSMAEQNIFIFADQSDDCHRLPQYGLRHVNCEPHSCMHPQLNLPMAQCIFQLGRRALNGSRLGLFINSDIIVTRSFFASLACVDSLLDRYVAVGQRYDVVRGQEQAEAGMNLLQNYVKVLHGTYGLDYFAFTNPFLDGVDLKDFVLGAWRWDNYLLSETVKSGQYITVDMTKTARVYHEQQNRNFQHHSVRHGAQHNSELTERFSNKDYKFGSTDFADYEAVGDCERSQCTLLTKPRDNGLIQIAKRASAPNGTVAMVVVNYGYVQLAMNWLCWVRLLQFENYIFMPEDDYSYQHFRGMQVPVLDRNFSYLVMESSDYGSYEFQQIMTSRTRYIKQILDSGKNVLLSDVDTIWIDNPLKYLDESCDIQGQTHKQTRISGGFLWVRSSPTARLYWAEVIKCQEQNERIILEILKTRELTAHERSAYTEQECINDIGLSWHRSEQYQFKFCQLNAHQFVDGKSYFTQKDFTRTGIQPVIVHNNWIIGMESKVRRMNDYNLLLWNNAQKRCIYSEPPPQPQLLSASPPHFDSQGDNAVTAATVSGDGKYQLGISILTSHRFESVKRLIASIKQNTFTGLGKVDLAIFVDYPPKTDDKTLADHRKLIQYVQTIRWSHGSIEIKVHDKNQGIESMWLNAFHPSTDTEMRLILEDDLLLSPLAMQLIRRSIDRYFLSKDAEDGTTGPHPQIYGISLQNQHSVVGETMSQRYGTVKIPEIVGTNRTVYAFQQLGTWGSVFFGRQWRDFQEWHKEKHADPKFTPCVPSFISNAWWLRRKRSVWTIWHIRWAFEKGMFSLYFNFESMAPNKCLATNYRENGENFQDSSGQTCQPLSEVDWALGGGGRELPELKDVPFYDFFFRPVDCMPCIRERWRMLSNLAHEDLCRTIKKG